MIKTLQRPFMNTLETYEEQTSLARKIENLRKELEDNKEEHIIIHRPRRKFQGKLKNTLN